MDEGLFFGLFAILSKVGAGFYHSSFFLVIKIFLAIYISILFADIVILLILRGMGSSINVLVKGRNIPSVSQGSMRKKWSRIRERLESNNPSQYKVAILEADGLADKIIEGIGYKGGNMSERLEQVRPGQIENLEDLVRAHQTRNRIVYEADLILSKEEAEAIIVIYEKFLKNVEYL